jgi:excisionase family DNA binding protein
VPSKDEVTLDEAARLFRISTRTLRYAAAHGHLKARRWGRQWAVTAQAVEEWLAHGKHKPGPPARRPASDGADRH